MATYCLKFKSRNKFKPACKTKTHLLQDFRTWKIHQKLLAVFYLVYGLLTSLGNLPSTSGGVYLLEVCVRPEFEKELESLLKKFSRIESLVKKFPIWESYIVRNRLEDDLNLVCLANKYKEIPLGWGANRYKLCSTNQPTNYDGPELTGFICSVYINTLSLYGSHDKFGLFDIPKNYIYVDFANSNFYCRDEQLIDLLESLNSWYLVAREQSKESVRKRKIAEAEAELARLRSES
jgi:hypothetical protein